jgi:hypothetical protein
MSQLCATADEAVMLFLGHRDLIEAQRIEVEVAWRRLA